MLNVRLLTVEDENPELIYGAVHDALSQWLYVKKGLVNLVTPRENEKPWVKSLKEWEHEINHLSPEDDLVFCTVDLEIPLEAGSEDGNPSNGLSIVKRIENHHDSGRLHCCVLTGLANQDLEKVLIGENLEQVLFEYKGHTLEFPNMISYIKAQVIKELKVLTIPGLGSQKTICINEELGVMRGFYMSRGPYLIDPKTWHVPMLMVSSQGLGARSFLEFIAYLADAEFRTIDLRNYGVNEENYLYLRKLAREAKQASGEWPRTLLYLPGIDSYQPDKSGEPDRNCFEPLKSILSSLKAKKNEAFPVCLAFKADYKSRLHIQDPSTRGFIRSLESAIDALTDSPLEHLAVDEFGWPVGHSRILIMPPLNKRGGDFIKNASHQLIREKDAQIEKPPRLADRSLTLESDVYDLLIKKTDWSKHGNLGGLTSVLDHAFNNFLANRSAGQFEITATHFDQDTRKRLAGIVLKAKKVSLSFPSATGGSIHVIDHINFDVTEGEVLVVLGPSGCGKSSILNLFAGLVSPTKGKLFYRKAPIEEPQQKVGMVFQDYSLFPWQTVEDNVSFGPRHRGVPSEEYTPKVHDLLKVAGLFEARHEYPGQLSGGMRQRVAIIRALANDSDILLMDEPFGALDLNTRWGMQEFLLKTIKKERKTVVFVTHDIDEAVFVADRIYIASPRPLKLGKPIVIPFSVESRNLALRHDPTFVDRVSQVRNQLLALMN